MMKTCLSLLCVTASFFIFCGCRCCVEPLSNTVVNPADLDRTCIVVGSATYVDDNLPMVIDVECTAPNLKAVNNGYFFGRGGLFNATSRHRFAYVLVPADDSEKWPGHYRFLHWRADNRVAARFPDGVFQKILAPGGKIVYIGDIRCSCVNDLDPEVESEAHPILGARKLPVQYGMQDDFEETMLWFKREYPKVYEQYKDRIINESGRLMDELMTSPSTRSEATFF